MRGTIRGPIAPIDRTFLFRRPSTRKARKPATFQPSSGCRITSRMKGVSCRVSGRPASRSALILTSHTGIVLVDPVRHLDVVRYTFGTWILRERKHEQFQVPCFVQSAQQGSVIGNDRVNGRVRRKSATTGFGEERVLNRLIGALQRANNGGTAMQSPDKAVVMAMAEIVCDDFSDVVDRIGCAIDDIDLTIHNDRILQESVSRWREQLGRWQNILIHQRRFLGHTSRSLAGRANTDLELEGHGLESRLATLETEIDWTARRAQTTFQSLMSSIAIVESARAIREAESVAKLTQLAFFFVPLALVASVFGMNIVVSDCPEQYLGAGGLTRTAGV